MSENFQHQGVFRISKPVLPLGAPKRMKTRNRATASCSACRARKLKCDRQTPCSSCLKRKDTETCEYTNGQIERQDHLEQGASRTAEARARLQRLEEMVTSLMQTPSLSSAGIPQGGPSLGTISTYDNITTMGQSCDSMGHLESYGIETSYEGATHWATILDNIKGIQDSLGSSQRVKTTSNSADHDILFDSPSSLTIHDVLVSLPSRPIVDKILSAFFNAGHIQIIPLIHISHFTREYEEFWSTGGSSASFLWISILFSMLSLGTYASQAGGQPVTQDLNGSVTANFLETARRALVKGEYQKVRPHSVESVLLYAVCKYARKEDPDSEVWMIMGIAVRLALKMGYHRDPRHFPHITPFEGEMRRRAFLFIDTFDLILSFQAGLPAIIHEELCDVEPPRNLLDSDFEEDCQILPPSRPLTDSTPMLYYCTKGQLAKILRRVHRLELSSINHSYEDTMKLDHELRDMHYNIPPSLRMKSSGTSFADPKYMSANRTNLEILYLQVVCILHRRYLTYERSNIIFEYSRKSCVKAALRLLELQAELQAAYEPDIQRYEDRWMMTSIALQAFLLAAMIISLDLYEGRKTFESNTAEDIQSHARNYNALQACHNIWMSRKHSSKEARRVSSILQILLSKISKPQFTTIDDRDIPDSMLPGIQIAYNSESSTECHWANTFSLSTEQTSSLGFPEYESHNVPNLDLTGPLDTAFDGTDSIDWALMDQFLLGQHGEEDFDFDWQLSDNQAK